MKIANVEFEVSVRPALNDTLSVIYRDPKGLKGYIEVGNSTDKTPDLNAETSIDYYTENNMCEFSCTTSDPYSATLVVQALLLEYFSDEAKVPESFSTVVAAIRRETVLAEVKTFILKRVTVMISHFDYETLEEGISYPCEPEVADEINKWAKEKLGAIVSYSPSRENEYILKLT